MAPGLKHGLELCTHTSPWYLVSDLTGFSENSVGHEYLYVTSTVDLRGSRVIKDTRQQSRPSVLFLFVFLFVSLECVRLYKYM